MKDVTYEAADRESAPGEHVVLVAGDLTGAARAAAFAYARNGNHIVLAGGDDLAGLKLTNELLARHVDAEFVHADIGDDAEVRAVAEATTLYYGHLDVEYLEQSRRDRQEGGSP